MLPLTLLVITSALNDLVFTNLFRRFILRRIGKWKKILKKVVINTADLLIPEIVQAFLQGLDKNEIAEVTDLLNSSQKRLNKGVSSGSVNGVQAQASSAVAQDPANPISNSPAFRNMGNDVGGNGGRGIGPDAFDPDRRNAEQRNPLQQPSILNTWLTLSSSWIKSGLFSTQGSRIPNMGQLTIIIKPDGQAKEYGPYTYPLIPLDIWRDMVAARGKNGSGAGSVFWRRWLHGWLPSRLRQYVKVNKSLLTAQDQAEIGTLIQSLSTEFYPKSKTMQRTDKRLLDQMMPIQRNYVKGTPIKKTRSMGMYQTGTGFSSPPKKKVSKQPQFSANKGRQMFEQRHQSGLDWVRSKEKK